MYKVLDLFSGAGGMSLGFVQTGKFHIAVAVENHPHAKATYIRNHKDTVLLDDILKINDYNAFKHEFGNFDIVVGGPPCQGFSNANRQKNHIISQNNSLVKKYVEVIENLRPLGFVMENVRMLRSDTHRFYLSKDDDFDELEISLRRETLSLYNGAFPFEDIEEFIFNPKIIEELLLPEKSLNILKLFLKNSYKEEKRSEVLNKKGKKCFKILSSVPDRDDFILLKYKQFEKKSIKYFVKYLEGNITFRDAEPYMSSYIDVQRLFSSAKEILDNNIIIDSLKINAKGIHADVHSYSVIEYMNKKLGRFYLIDDDVLNAAWFGAPQLRERYIALGIRKDIAMQNNIKPELPKPEFLPEDYRTVWDAIKDLEDVEPCYTIKEVAIDLSKSNKVSYKAALTSDLRISNLLYNHIITETTETALNRFATLKPGQNFHNLEKGLIQSTYSKPERTQNSIYMRLDYYKPSGTVTNVRKSMWIHPTINRAISIREAARLQTFPDNFIFEGTKDSQYQQVGNAVPPIMAKAIAKKLSELLDACRNYSCDTSKSINSQGVPSSVPNNQVKEHNTENEKEGVSA